LYNALNIRKNVVRFLYAIVQAEGKMSVRLAKAEDAQRITEINLITWEDTYRGLMPDEILNNRIMNEGRVLHCKENIISGDNIVLVYEADDKNVVGYIWAGKSRNNDIELFHEIYGFYVDPKFQGNGYGTQLMNEYKKHINDEHFYLYMLKGNKTHDFYIKMGGVEMKGYAKSMKINNHRIEEVLYRF
jgi:ribosomal protein S18 acetylase RimI-like enzyme